MHSCTLHVWLKLHSGFTGVAAMPPQKKQKARTKQKDKARAKPLDPLMKRPASKRPASLEPDDGTEPPMKRPAFARPASPVPDDGTVAVPGYAKRLMTLQDQIDEFVIRSETKQVKARWEACHHASGWYLLEPEGVQAELTQVHAAISRGGKTDVEYQWPSGSGPPFVLDLAKFTKKNMRTGALEDVRFIIS